jgi:hypothetical protein
MLPFDNLIKKMIREKAFALTHARACAPGARQEIHARQGFSLRENKVDVGRMTNGHNMWIKDAKRFIIHELPLQLLTDIVS